MPVGDVDEISRLLGAIIARLDGIERNQHDERESAMQHRQALHVTVSAQAMATATLAADLKLLSVRVSEITLLTDDYRSTRDQAIGAAKIVMAFRVAVVGLVATVAGIITWITSHK